MVESWKPVVGEDPTYEVSDLGKVRHHSVRFGLCVMKPCQRAGTRYQQVTFYRPVRVRVRRYIHRMVAEAFVPNPEGRPYVNHKDGNRLNNRADNLEWATALENHRHAHTNGLLRGKAAMIRATLSDADVATIRSLLASGNHNMREMAERFNVSPTHVSRIWRNLDRRDVEAPVKPAGFRTAFYHRKRKAPGHPTTDDPELG